MATPARDATATLHGLFLDAAGDVIEGGRRADIGIEGPIAAVVAASWAPRDPYLYRRFDFAFDGSGPPILLEYNPDTPSSLLEAAVISGFG